MATTKNTTKSSTKTSTSKNVGTPINSDTKDLFKKLEDKFNIFFEPKKIKTGIIPLDLALNGYLETGTLMELSGESQTGKSTLLLHLCRNLCELGHNIVYIDTEGSVKEDQLIGIKVQPYVSTKNKPNRFTLVKESGYSEVESLITEFLKYGQHKIFIIDSLSALTGDVYLNLKEDRNSTEARMGFDALMNTKLLKKLSALKTEHDCIFIFINQTRVDLNSFVKTNKPAGGQAVKFFPDVRLFMKHKKKLVEKKELIMGVKEVPIGAETTLETHKSRLGLSAIPYPMTVYFGKGISNLNAYAELLPNINIKVGNTKKPMLEKTSSVTNVINLPSGPVRSTKGEAGIREMIVANIDEIEPIINNHLEEYFESLHQKATDTSTPPELGDYDEVDVIEEDVIEEE